jgi:hypothetical protein
MARLLGSDAEAKHCTWSVIGPLIGNLALPVQTSSFLLVRRTFISLVFYVSMVSLNRLP